MLMNTDTEIPNKILLNFPMHKMETWILSFSENGHWAVTVQQRKFMLIYKIVTLFHGTKTKQNNKTQLLPIYISCAGD